MRTPHTVTPTPTAKQRISAMQAKHQSKHWIVRSTITATINQGTSTVCLFLCVRECAEERCHEQPGAECCVSAAHAGLVLSSPFQIRLCGTAQHTNVAVVSFTDVAVDDVRKRLCCFFVSNAHNDLRDACFCIKNDTNSDAARGHVQDGFFDALLCFFVQSTWELHNNVHTCCFAAADVR